MKSLTFLLVFIYLLIETMGGVMANNECYYQLGLSQQGIESGKIWQFLSYAVLHGNTYHFVVNGILLWVLGGKLQSIVGVKKAISILAVGVTTGGGLQLGLSYLTENGHSSLLVGVSGGIMALLLGLTTMDPCRVLRPLRIRARHLGLGFLMSEAIFTLIDPSLGIPVLTGVGHHVASAMGEPIFLVAHACHLGGGIAGLILGKIILSNSDQSGL
ncbi:MAG: rhomboid family intramembrane serine protease [Rubritalea sp.]|uniref:rhomboid family intramembrane serine protease n=1 Tax=Rubritalea sp. TaxID=2109375 RepID=UPI003242BEFB